MRKILALACVAACIFALGACGADKAEPETETTVSEQGVTAPRVTTTTTRQMPEDEWVAQNREMPDVLPTLAPGEIKLLSEEQAKWEIWPVRMTDEIPYDDLTVDFRYCYYSSYGSFWTLAPDVDPEEYDEWLKTLPPPEDFVPNGTADEMPLVTLVKHFRVPKHVFVAEVEKNRQIHSTFDGYDPSSETQELPNADIIYTFDNDIINAYYSR